MFWFEFWISLWMIFTFKYRISTRLIFNIQTLLKNCISEFEFWILDIRHWTLNIHQINIWYSNSVKTFHFWVWILNIHQIDIRYWTLCGIGVCGVHHNKGLYDYCLLPGSEPIITTTPWKMLHTISDLIIINKTTRIFTHL